MAYFMLFNNFITSRSDIFDNSLLSSQGLTARRDPTNKVCYVSKLDSSFSPPGEMKQEMEQVRIIEGKIQYKQLLT